MTKQNGSYAPDGSKYGTLTDGAGLLISHATVDTATPKPTPGAKAPDGSIYFTMTDGQGNLS